MIVTSFKKVAKKYNKKSEAVNKVEERLNIKLVWELIWNFKRTIANQRELIKEKELGFW